MTTPFFLNTEFLLRFPFLFEVGPGPGYGVADAIDSAVDGAWEHDADQLGAWPGFRSPAVQLVNDDPPGCEDSWLTLATRQGVGTADEVRALVNHPQSTVFAESWPAGCSDPQGRCPSLTQIVRICVAQGTRVALSSGWHPEEFVQTRGPILVTEPLHGPEWLERPRWFPQAAQNWLASQSELWPPHMKHVHRRPGVLCWTGPEGGISPLAFPVSVPGYSEWQAHNGGLASLPQLATAEQLHAEMVASGTAPFPEN